MNWKSILSVILVVTTATAQAVYHLPFASTGNTIELVVANSSTVEATEVKVSLQNAPAWLQFVQKEQKISSLAAGEEQRAVFVFAVDKSAPVGEEQVLTIVISNSTGERWTKEIRVVVSPPESFELFQNYPNPFNSTTTIGYQLPVAAHISLKIFNMLGQEVTTLFQQEQSAGYHQETFNTQNFASGIYVYQLIATAADGTRFTAGRAMVLVK